MKTNILNSYCIGFDKVMSRTFLRLDSLSILSRQSVLAIFVACLTVLGIGNAWGATTGTIYFGNSGTKINSSSVSGNDSQSNTWTITTSGTTSYTQQTGYSQVGSKDNPATSITFTMTLGAAQRITAFSADFGGFSDTDGDVSLTVGSTEIGSGSLSGTSDVTISNDISAVGTVLTVSVTNIAKGVKCYSISYTYEAASAQTVTFNKQGGTFDDPSVFINTNQIKEQSAGAGITLPLVNPSSACASEGWGFLGWATSAVASETTTAPTIVGQAGDTYYPTSDITLHAVFAKGEYTKITSGLDNSSKYIFVAVYSTKNYVMTSKYLSKKLKAKQIDESSSGKYNAALIDPSWCYTLEANSSSWHIVDCNSAHTNHYLDVSFADWYGHTKDTEDPYTIAYSTDHWTITSDYDEITVRWFAYSSEDGAFVRSASSQDLQIYKAGTIYYHSTPSCCANEVSVSESGSSHITSMAFSESSVATCGDAASRTITITVTPASGYSLFGTTKPVFTKTSGTVTATIGSVTDNGDGTFSYECTFNSNDNGAGTFAISPGQFINYRTLCCAEHDITLADYGEVTGGIFSADLEAACAGKEIFIEAAANTGYDFTNWEITETSTGDDIWDDVKMDGFGEQTDTEAYIEMQGFPITVNAVFTPQTYSITYYDGDEEDDDKTFSGTHETGYPTSHTYDAATTLKSATKSGFNFGGWYDNKECEGDPITSLGATDYTADVVLYAKWIDDSKWTVTIGSHANGSLSVTYTGMESALTSGSREIEKNTELTISATPNTGYTLTNLTVGDEDDFTNEGTHTLTGNITVSATFSAINYTITYNLNDGVNNGDNVASYTIKDEVWFEDPTKTGYHFDGWFTDAEFDTENEIIGIDEGSTGNVVVYAKWSANSYDVTLKPNGGTGSDQVVSATYDATMPITVKTAGTDIVIPTREGYTFTGWWDATSGGNKYYNADGTSARTWNVAEATNLYAQWSINEYNVAVSAVGDVTISATSPSIAEGGNADVNYGSTVTLSYSGVASGKTWGGWNVYRTGDASTTVTVTSNQFTMPDYNVTVSAIIFGDAIAWCDPDVEVTGNVHLTSYNGVPVYTTSGADNLIEISSSDFGSATRLEVAYLDADNADAEVDKAESVFRFCSSSDYSTIDGMDLDYEWGTTHSIRYTPNAYNKRDNYKLQLILKRGDKVLKTVNYNIYGRALPQEFVIASKFNDEWYALPNTMGTATETVTPLKITVDNTTTPTAATYAPETTVYKGAARKTATSNRNSIRLTNDGSHWLITNNSNAQLGLSGTETEGYENREVWYLKSSDFGAYTLKMDPAMSPTKQLGIYGGNMGMYATPTSPSGAIYLLPITNKYTEIAATVSEWGEHGVIVQPNTPSDLLGVASATMNIDGASPSAATTSAVNAGMGTAKRVRVYDDGGDLTVGAVANEGKLLYIHWKNSGGSEIGVSQIQIPYVVAADGAMKTLIGAKDTWAKKEVHVLPGVTLTADAGNFGGSAVTIPTLHIYPGATLNVSTGTLTATTLRLHNGWTRAGEKAYDVARVYINAANDAALTKTTASMDYDIYELTDGQHFYPLAVPFPVAVSAIDYADSWLAGYSKYGMEGQYVIKEYDGARRAEKGPDQQNNWRVVNDDATLSPGKGYIMAAVPVYGEAIIRIPLTFDNAWTADGELGTVSAVTKNVVAVTAYEGSATAGDKKVNKGWNLLGVPFMSCYATDEVGNKDAIIQGRYDFNTNTWIDGTIRYVNVPSHDFAEYIQSDVTDPETVLRPGWCFMVQIETSGNLTFMTAGEAENSSLPIYAPKRGMKADMPTVETGIILSDGEKSDKTTFLVSDKYNGAEYEINADLEKLFGNGYTLATYSISGETRLAYNAMSNADAANIIPIGYRAPAEGEYTFSINPRYAQNGAFESVNLIDYETGIVTDLLQSSYTFSTERTQNDARFALNVVPRQETPTDLEDVQGDDVQGTKVRKMIINDQLFIIRDGQMYDVTGRMVK